MYWDHTLAQVTLLSSQLLVPPLHFGNICHETEFFQTTNTSRAHWKHSPRTFYLSAEVIVSGMLLLVIQLLLFSSENEVDPGALAIEITSSRKENIGLSSALMEFQHFSTPFQDSWGCALSRWRCVNKILKHWHKIATSGRGKCSRRPKGKRDEMREKLL